ncbi:MAG TPA: DUF2085 domain-containing protein [Thermoflexia bacterium]|jgi:uncharacterized membrane protein|nr:DUF2085 domain-containing protein [Thermoflexia bacterium]
MTTKTRVLRSDEQRDTRLFNRLFARHWLAWTNTVLGLLWGLPWLAPVLMALGAGGPARAIYTLYRFLCHQLADRSFFLFGPKLMYTYSELLPFAPDADTWLGLRSFVGAPELGYKVAWSDRMVWMYGGMLLGGLLFALFRRRLKPLGWRRFALMIAPMAVDGGTHWLSDFAGVGRGFRYDNTWLAAVTGHLLPRWFYVGNAVGSFNFWMRLITGLLFGLTVVWLAYPVLDGYFRGDG